jgi:hypothetical protein
MHFETPALTLIDSFQGGDTCSDDVGYCCSPGSFSSGCSGSGSDLTSFSSYTYSYTSPTSTSFSSSSDDDDDDDSSSDDTGVSQFSDTNVGSRDYEVQIVAGIFGLFGLGMLLL